VHPGGPIVLQFQGGPPGAGTIRPNGPTESAAAQRHRGGLPRHPLGKTYPKPEVRGEGPSDALRVDLDDVFEEYQAFWAGQLGKVDVTPHRIEVTPGARTRRAEPFRASQASREASSKVVQRK